jgi:hypothetical protein
MDTGLDPTITSVAVTCDKWSTPDGLHVGSAMTELNGRIGAYYGGTYCPLQYNDGRYEISTKVGITFTGRNRNSPITKIDVFQATGTLQPLCRD